MKSLIFGNQNFPDLSFRLDPPKGLAITCKDSYVLDYEGLGETITWKDLLDRTNPSLGGFRGAIFLPEAWDRWWKIVKEILVKLPQTRAERDFLKAYLDWSERKSMSDEFRTCHEVGARPALIPQAWVNWIHYDSTDSERAKAIKEQPFRVDFLMYHDNRWLVIEIDGPSHFAEILDIDMNQGTIRFDASMKKYSEHLKKDRWLRKQGWEVWRFSDDEVKEVLQNAGKTDPFGIENFFWDIGCDSLFP